jgi:hypothetical protein
MFSCVEAYSQLENQRAPPLDLAPKHRVNFGGALEVLFFVAPNGASSL